MVRYDTRRTLIKRYVLETMLNFFNKEFKKVTDQ